jgi:hypothetical protein
MKKSDIKRDKLREKLESDQESGKDEGEIKEEEGEVKLEHEDVLVWSLRAPKDGSRTPTMRIMRTSGSTWSITALPSRILTSRKESVSPWEDSRSSTPVEK